ETVIRAGTAQELTEATFPAFQDSDILKASDFFKSLIQRKAADVTQKDI
ncbi:antirestriction protein ArdR, partial [Klebsiella pneumoniae]|nr:antirestriction protein ArdR [Klebsiella pneumoniae]